MPSYSSVTTGELEDGSSDGLLRQAGESSDGLISALDPSNPEGRPADGSPGGGGSGGTGDDSPLGSKREEGSNNSLRINSSSTLNEETIADGDPAEDVVEETIAEGGPAVEERSDGAESDNATNASGSIPRIAARIDILSPRCFFLCMACQR